MSILTIVKASAIAILDTHARIIKSTYLRYCGRYVENSMWLVPHISCQMHRTPACFRYVLSGFRQCRHDCSFAYSCLNVQINLYSAYLPVCAMSILDRAKSSVFAVLHTQSKILISTYLRLKSSNDDHSMRIILHICCQISRFVPRQLWTRSNSV